MVVLKKLFAIWAQLDYGKQAVTSLCKQLSGGKDSEKALV
jgi:hypothetical protein